MILMWQDTQDGITAECYYCSEEHNFLVKVFNTENVLEEKFEAYFEPLYGMDVIDRNNSLNLAEELAQKLE